MKKNELKEAWEAGWWARANQEDLDTGFRDFMKDEHGKLIAEKDAEIARLKVIVSELIEQLGFYEGDEQIGIPAEIMKRAREAIGQ